MYNTEKVRVQSVVQEFDPSKKSSGERKSHEDYNTTQTECSMDVSRIEINDLDESKNLSVVPEAIDMSQAITPRKEPAHLEIDLDQTSSFYIDDCGAPESKQEAEKRSSDKKVSDDTEVPDESYRHGDESLTSNGVLTKTGLDQGMKCSMHIIF